MSADGLKRGSDSSAPIPASFGALNAAEAETTSPARSTLRRVQFFIQGRLDSGSRSLSLPEVPLYPGHRFGQTGARFIRRTKPTSRKEHEVLPSPCENDLAASLEDWSKNNSTLQAPKAAGLNAEMYGFNGLFVLNELAEEEADNNRNMKEPKRGWPNSSANHSMPKIV